MKKLQKFSLLAICALSLTSLNRANAQLASFTAGDLVISTVSDQIHPGTATNADLDTASPITLDQLALNANLTSATPAGTLTLPTTSVGGYSAISGEYGSASEGILQDSVNGDYLTMMGYGVNANTFNTASLSTYGTTQLGQTTSLVGQADTTVPRVVALIGANGNMDTSTALTGVFNDNNPRSVATVNGTSFYVSGQGVTGDGTGGVFQAQLGATTATAINNNTSSSPTGSSPSQGTETRSVQIVNTGTSNAPVYTVMASRDVKVSGTPNDASDIRSFTTSTPGVLPTSAANLTVTRVIAGNNSTNTAALNLTTSLENGVNNSRVGSTVYLSPEQFFLAEPNIMYVADSGSPKNGSAGAAQLGEGGLQKWVNSATNGSGTWSLEYDLSAGLNLVNNANANSNNPTAPGVTGLFGLAGQVESNGTVELFATSYGLNELSTSYLYGITDTLSDTTIAQANTTDGSFATLDTAAAGTEIRGVAFAPQGVPEPSSWVMAVICAALFGYMLKRRMHA